VCKIKKGYFGQWNIPEKWQNCGVSGLWFSLFQASFSGVGFIVGFILGLMGGKIAFSAKAQHLRPNQ